ncbi:MAG: hypothetical protein IPN94_07605 [Sphingobacteriales bacterium]|nr:hypothetical protein [Sphingobacteriales bacterium]
MKKNEKDNFVIDFDARWKELIHSFTEDFIAFFLPTLYPLVDFTKPPEFLEQELQKLFPNEELAGKKISDKLIRLYLKDGQEWFVLVHIEVEGDAPTAYSKEVFKYYYRILDRHEVDITTIVVYVGDKVPKHHNIYTRSFHGTELIFKFNTYIVKKQDPANLLASDNVFALAILANLYVLQSKNQFDKRFAFKYQLLDLLLQKNYPKQTIKELFVFIDYLMLLPKELEQQLSIKIKKVMTFIHKGHRLLINDLSIQEYGKSVEQMLKEIENAVAKEEQLLAQQKAKEEQLLAQQKAKEEQLLAQQKAKEEQLLAQQKAKEEQLLAQQKAKEEQLIVNMHQNLHIDSQTIATICNIPLEIVQQVLTQKGLI